MKVMLVKQAGYSRPVFFSLPATCIWVYNNQPFCLIFALLLHTGSDRVFILFAKQEEGGEKCKNSYAGLGLYGIFRDHGYHHDHKKSKVEIIIEPVSTDWRVDQYKQEPDQADKPKPNCY